MYKNERKYIKMKLQGSNSLEAIIYNNRSL